MSVRARERRRYSGETVRAVTWPWKSFGDPSALPRTGRCTHTVRTKQRKQRFTRRMWWGNSSSSPDLASRREREKGKRTVSHQTSAGVLRGAAHIGPAREVIEIEPEAILQKSVVLGRCGWGCDHDKGWGTER